MFKGYLEFGGNEVGNNARAYGYASTADCPARWILDPHLSGFNVAVGDGTYSHATISEAPWYDPDEPDLSARFFGLSVIDVKGLPDSTREASITQKNGPGAQVSGYRHAAREVRVRGWLTAAGEDALEAGMTWLRNVLEPDACGMHGGTCGTADLAFFVSKPPPQGDVADLLPWEEDVRTNLITNPRMISNITGWSVSGIMAQTATPDGTRLDSAAGSAGLSSFFYNTVNPAALVGQEWTGSIEVTVPLGYPALTMRARVAPFAGGTPVSTSTGTGSAVTVQPGETVRIDTGVLVTPATTNAVRLYLASAAEIPAGARLIVRNALLEQTGVHQPYFDGATVPVFEDGQEVARYAWAGAADASASTMDTRTWYFRPQTNEEYVASIASYRRYLHSVRAISGPFEISERLSNDGIHRGRLVEFTLVAEVPWVYGITKEIDVPPMIPTIVQDIVFNLAEYPSAELADPAPLLVATNYSTNPSVETDATGWSVNADGASILVANVAGARSTELAAVGAASYKSTFTTPAASAVSGWFGAQQTVTLPAWTTEKFSITVWASGLIQSGTAVLDRVEAWAEWQNAASAVLRTDALGTFAPGGGPMALSTITPPATATKVVVRTRLVVTSRSTGAVLALYTDALAVTKP